MPIEVFCETCQKKLRVPDTAAGKRIKCPKCQGVIAVPAAEGGAAPAASPTPAKTPAPAPATVAKTPATAPKAPATPAPKAEVAKVPENWFVQTEDGEQYGPVSREELDSWYADGRVTADTQLLLEGSAQWQWATDIYPELSSGGAAAPATDNGFPAIGSITKAPAAATTEPAAEASPAATTPTTTTTKTATKSTAKRGAVAKKSSKKAPPEEVGERSKMVAGLLGIFLGVWGIHNFYLGFTKIAIIQIVVSIFTCGLGGIWGFVEGILILMGSIDRDADGKGLKQ